MASSAKLSRTELKSILKECLREILKEEGILVSEQARASVVPSREFVSKKSAPVIAEEQESNVPGVNPLLIERVGNVIGTIGEDSKDMMARIFMDTAMTTLQAQNGAGHNAQAGGYGSAAEAASSFTMSEAATHAGAAAPVGTNEQLKSIAPMGNTKLWAQIAFAKK